MERTLQEMSQSEIWDGWCGSASPSSDEGHFDSLEDAISYVRDRISDWGNEPLEVEDGKPTRYISDMTEDEIQLVAEAIIAYFEDNNS